MEQVIVMNHDTMNQACNDNVVLLAIAEFLSNSDVVNWAVFLSQGKHGAEDAQNFSPYLEVRNYITLLAPPDGDGARRNAQTAASFVIVEKFRTFIRAS